MRRNVLAVLFAVSCLLSAALAVQPSFDAREVVKQVRGAGHNPIPPGELGLCPKPDRRCPPAEGGRPPFDDAEFLIDTTGVHAEWEPSVAFDGTNFLVVWQDGRGSDYDIYGARVTPQGTVLDPQSFVISQAASSQYDPALGFDGTNFLVVWVDRRSGSYSDIYGARVSPAGTVLDPLGIAISTAADDQGSSAVAFDGTNWLVVWSDYRSGGYYSDIYGARVTPQGTVFDPSGFVILQAADAQYLPALAFDGANFLVVWTDWRTGRSDDIYGARVTPQGTVLDPSGFVISQAASSQGAPALGFDGANFLVVWEDRRSGNCSNIYGARVTLQGTVLDPNGIPISTAANQQYCVPAVSFDGTSFLVVWRDEHSSPDTSDICGARVTPAGTVYDEGPVVRQEGNQDHPALSRGPGSQLFLVYQGWADTVDGKTYNTDRIWGKMDPVPGVVEETMNDERGTMNGGATIVSSILLLPKSQAPNTKSQVELLDASGRKVMELHPGANDVSRLPAGVYFVVSPHPDPLPNGERMKVRGKLSAVSCQKVVIQR